MRTADLTPRSVTIRDVTQTSASVRYDLPLFFGNEKKDVMVRVGMRPALLYKQTMANEMALQTEISQLRFKQQQLRMRDMMNNGGKPIDQQKMHQTMMDNESALQPYRQRISEAWRDYNDKLRRLFSIEAEEGGGDAVNGFVVLDSTRSKYVPLTYALTSDDDACVIPHPHASVETAEIQLPEGKLSPNTFYEVVVWVTRKNDSSRNDEGASIFSSPSTPPAAFTTLASPWQTALERNGLKYLIEPFAERGLGDFSKWVDLPHEVKVDLQIDATVENQLAEILSREGIVTPAERAKLEREKVDLENAVSKLLAEYQQLVAKETLQVGDPVKSRGGAPARFGVIVEPAQAKRGDDVNVRWEDAGYTHDPANAPVERGVKASSLQLTKFNVFISHAQHQAQNSVAALTFLLRDRGVRAWWDQDAERLEARDMLRGIANSEYFLLYLTSEYLTRWFCRLEISVAIALKKPFLIVFESDERHGGSANYVALVDYCTAKYSEFRATLLGVEAIAMARRAFQRRAVVEEILKRMGGNAGRGGAGSSNGGGGSIPANKRTSFLSLPSFSSGNAGGTGGSEEIAALKAMILDLKSEMDDLKQENRQLWDAVRGTSGR